MIKVTINYLRGFIFMFRLYVLMYFNVFVLLIKDLVAHYKTSNRIL